MEVKYVCTYVRAKLPHKRKDLLENQKRSHMNVEIGTIFLSNIKLL